TGLTSCERGLLSKAIQQPHGHTAFPYTTLFRSRALEVHHEQEREQVQPEQQQPQRHVAARGELVKEAADAGGRHVERGQPALDGDRKSTRLNSSHVKISYAVFCLKKKTSNMIDA